MNHSWLLWASIKIYEISTACFVISLVFPIIMYLVDVISDIKLAIRYFLDGHYGWAGCTIAFVLLSWFLFLIIALFKEARLALNGVFDEQFRLFLAIFNLFPIFRDFPIFFLHDFRNWPPCNASPVTPPLSSTPHPPHPWAWVHLFFILHSQKGIINLFLEIILHSLQAVSFVNNVLNSRATGVQRKVELLLLIK